MRTQWCALIVSAVVITACGKNDGFRTTGYMPYGPVMQAPPPPGGAYPAPPVGYQPTMMPSGPGMGGYPSQPFPGPVPPGGYGGGYGGGSGGGYGPYSPSPYMVPTLPPGQPQRYTPFVPIDNYMRRRPETYQYWTNFWGDWQQYAGRNNYDPYDFNRFWFDYCPNRWEGGNFAGMYNHFDANVYFWVDMETTFSTTSSADYFWFNYNGMPYTEVDGICDLGCY